MSTWIFLRGLTRDSRHWGEFPAAFASALGCAPPQLLDLDGCGARHQLTSPWKVTDMVDCYRRQLAARGIAPPYRLLALSMGGMVAIAWARQFAQELAACVLVNTSLGRASPFYRRLRPGSYPDLLRLALFNRDPAIREEMVWRLTSRRAAQDTTILQWIEYQKRCPVSRRNALAQLMAAAAFRAPPSSPATSFLVLTSAGDRLVHPACSRHLATQWKTGFAMHPDAGHDLPLDDGAWVIREVAQWLRAAA